MGGPLDGWLVALNGLAALAKRRGSALALGCGRGGRVVLRSPRAAAVSTRLRVQRVCEPHMRVDARGALRHLVRVRVRVRVRA